MGKDIVPDIIRMPDAASFGPAMLALNQRQRAFVFAMFALGQSDLTAAARLAGYADNGGGGIRVQAHMLAHNPRVQAAIDEWQKRSSKTLIPFARANIVKMAADPQNKDAFKANMAIMGMGGHGPVTETKHTHEIILTRDEKIAEIAALAKALGRDPAEFLGQVVDAEFTEVPTGNTVANKQRRLTGDEVVDDPEPEWVDDEY